MLFFSTSSLEGYGLHKIFLLAKKAEYQQIDLCVDFSQYDTFNEEYIRHLQDITHVQVGSITAPEKKLTTEQVESVIELAHKLEVPMVNLHPPHRLEKEKNWFGSYLQTLQKKYPNTLINIINAPPKTWFFIIAEYGDARPATIKRMTKHTALSIANVDPNSGVDLMKTFVLLGSTLEFIYLSDQREGDDMLFPGEGLMPLESLLIKLKESNYTGNFSLQVTPRELGIGDDNKVVERLLQAKKYLEKYF